MARDKLYSSLTAAVTNFIEMDTVSKFNFIMSSNDYDINNICIKEVSNMLELREMLKGRHIHRGTGSWVVGHQVVFGRRFGRGPHSHWSPCGHIISYHRH